MKDPNRLERPACVSESVVAEVMHLVAAIDPSESLLPVSAAFLIRLTKLSLPVDSLAENWISKIACLTRLHLPSGAHARVPFAVAVYQEPVQCIATLASTSASRQVRKGTLSLCFSALRSSRSSFIRFLNSHSLLSCELTHS